MSQYRRQNKKIHPPATDGSSRYLIPNSMERVVELIYLILRAKSAFKNQIDTVSAVRTAIEKWVTD